MNLQHFFEKIEEAFSFNFLKKKKCRITTYGRLFYLNSNTHRFQVKHSF